MNVAQYLRRIGVARPRLPDLEFLSHLQMQHLLTVPFENLSVVGGEPVILDERDLYAKIVVQKRGGFCYELNGLFHWLLAQLGFEVTLVAAGVYQADSGHFGPPFDHMGLLVHLSCIYLVDVGFGDSARAPLALPAGVVRDLSGKYRIQRQDAAGDALLLEQFRDGLWLPQYRFTERPRKLEEYAQMCEYHRTSPNSPFTQRLICTRATSTGRVTLSENALTITEGKHKRKIGIASPVQGEQYLRTYFDIEPISMLPRRAWLHDNVK